MAVSTLAWPKPVQAVTSRVIETFRPHARGLLLATGSLAAALTWRYHVPAKMVNFSQAVFTQGSSLAHIGIEKTVECVATPISHMACSALIAAVIFGLGLRDLQHHAKFTVMEIQSAQRDLHEVLRTSRLDLDSLRVALQRFEKSELQAYLAEPDLDAHMSRIQILQTAWFLPKHGVSLSAS